MLRWGGRPKVHLHRPKFDCLTVVCAFIVLVHVALVWIDAIQNHPGLYEFWGLSRDGMLSGYVWQLVSHAFIHGNWIHLLGNLGLIYLAGGALQRILGGRWFIMVFAIGVLVGGVFHLLLHPGSIPAPQEPGGIVASGPLVGASGGAVALLVALTALAPDARVWPFPVRGKNFALGVMLAALLLYLFTPTLGIPGFAEVGRIAVGTGLGDLFQMAHACHFGGGLAGFLVMRRFLKKPVTLAQLQKERAKKEGNLAA